MDAPHDHRHTPPSDPEVMDPRTPRTIDLCSNCLCDPPKRNVVCKHDHLNDGTSHHLVLNKGLIPHNSTSLHILGFETVIIHKGTFSSESLALRQIHFENIGTIRLSKESLFFNSKAKENMETVVLFTRCNIKEIPTEAVTQYSRSKDQRNDIDLEETRFLTMQFRWCNITTIRSYAFYQARLLYFTMSHTKVEHMEENCIYLDIYEEWVVEDSHLPKLEQQTISLRAQMIVVFSRNIIDGLENRSLNINSSNQVLFEYNSVSHLGSEALMGIKPSGYARGANIVFLNNSIAKADNGSLATSRNYPAHERKVLDNKFGIVCDCNIKLNFRHLLGITTENDYYDQSTYQTVIEKSLCQRFAEVETYKYIESYYNEECTPLPLPIIISASIVLALIIITIIVCVVCTQRAARAKEEANYLGECCYSHSFSTLHSNPGPLVPLQNHQCQSWERGNNIQSWVMAVPEVKTYQETEVEMHYEHTEPMNVSLRGSYPEPLIDFHRKTQVRASCPFN
ncbi:hypothetical protein Hamer_G003346 [Homarus americanus]|uniref:Uncharacterized protein n=1 Tax=Homarus americanus TaxID=6706 RepID=A0A8J5TH36_HOMAM|nr:hypothetical protein Hamer_G003346 [Homarus americanus]